MKAVPHQHSPSWYARQRFLQNKPAVFGLGFIIFVSVMALLGHLICTDPSENANRQIPEISLSAPGSNYDLLSLAEQNKVSLVQKWWSGTQVKSNRIPIKSYKIIGNTVQLTPIDGEPRQIDKKNFQLENYYSLLGTDRFGRDIFSRIVLGSRVSLAVGFIAVFISLIIGITLGAFAGFYQGRVDVVIRWLINVVWSIPTFLLVMAMALVLGKGYVQIFIAVGLTMWVEVARLVRGQILYVRTLDYVNAGKALGYSHIRIIYKHILPNIAGPIWVIAATNFASAIVLEAGLSFIGLGVQPPSPSWGVMVAENYGFLVMSSAYMALIPGLCIALLVLAFNMVGSGLRDAQDVKTLV
ncbi:MAG: ABC transporter permease [Bacteroidota bacterium]|nr:ABC transporter permease [Bacteroidota bacterium]